MPIDLIDIIVWLWLAIWTLLTVLTVLAVLRGNRADAKRNAEDAP